MPIISAMNGALIMPMTKWSSEMASRRRAMKISGLNAAVEPAHQAAAVERRHRAEEGEDRQRDHQRDQARQHQHLDRAEPHGAQRVDLLAHLHRAELGRVGAARAARHHDRHHDDADLAQHQDADHVDHVELGAEAAEVEDALLRDDAAEQERDQQDDRHRLQADAVEVMHHRGEAEARRAHHDAQRARRWPRPASAAIRRCRARCRRPRGRRSQKT